MKKLFSILLVLAMLASVMVTAASAAETTDPVTSAVVSGTHASGYTGDVVTVSVSVNSVLVDDVAGVKAFQIMATYDNTNLKVVGAESPCGATVNAGLDNMVVATFASATPVDVGTVLNISFEILAAEGTHGVGVQVGELFGNGNVAITGLSVSGGSVTVLCPHTNTITVVENEVAATCGTAGSYDEVVYCSDCGHEISRVTKTIPATGAHTAAKAVRENEVAATCGKAGSYDEVVYCSVCGHEISRVTKTIPATGAHTEEVIPGKAPTCTEDGLTEGKKCSVCGEILVPQQKIPAKGHGDTEYVCNGDGTHDEICKDCGAVIVDNEKCYDKNGDGKCDCCGGPVATVPPTTDDPNDDDEPKNGDITPYPVYFLFAMMAVMATAFGLKRKFDV